MTKIPGPYLLDPDAGLAITGDDSTTVTALFKGQRYGSIEVADATIFPDEDGWLVFGFGYEYQVAPVKYLGRLSDTSLALDYGFKFTKDVPAGANVTRLLHKGAFNPENPESIGAFYITASPAGRVAAGVAIDLAVAASATVRKEITYPGGRGLGGEGLPTSGVNKLSDVVSIWAGNDQDAEIAKAREE
jgi:hypothetical protein